MDYIYGRAFAAWAAPPLTASPLKFIMVFLSESENPGDINNFVKPVQDALNALVYADDSLIRDISAHLRVLSEPGLAFDLLPPELGEAAIQGTECVYVAISDSPSLDEQLA